MSARVEHTLVMRGLSHLLFNQPFPYGNKNEDIGHDHKPTPGQPLRSQLLRRPPEFALLTSDGVPCRVSGSTDSCARACTERIACSASLSASAAGSPGKPSGPVGEPTDTRAKALAIFYRHTTHSDQISESTYSFSLKPRRLATLEKTSHDCFILPQTGRNARTCAAAGLSCAAPGTSRWSEWRLPLRRCCRVKEPPAAADGVDDADSDRSDVRLLDDGWTPAVKEPLPRSDQALPALAPLPLRPLPLPPLPAARLAAPPLVEPSGLRPVEMRLSRLGEADVDSRSLGDDIFLTACDAVTVLICMCRLVLSDDPPTAGGPGASPGMLATILS